MESNSKRILIKPSEIIIIVLVLLLCGIFIYFSNKNSNITLNLTAEISYKGEQVLEIELDKTENKIFKLAQNENVSFEILEGKIRFCNTDCPDKLCENFGYLDKINQTAICLPNMVSLRLTGEKEGIDDVDIIAN